MELVKRIMKKLLKKYVNNKRKKQLKIFFDDELKSSPHTKA